jgi:hypothetical protein
MRMSREEVRQLFKRTIFTDIVLGIIVCAALAYITVNRIIGKGIK